MTVILLSCLALINKILVTLHIRNVHHLAKKILMVLLIIRLKSVHSWTQSYKYEKDAAAVNRKQNGS